MKLMNLLRLSRFTIVNFELAVRGHVAAVEILVF